MSAVLLVSGWAACLCLGVVSRRRAGLRAEVSARAAHEIRGPLQAAGLALVAAGRGTAGALTAVEHELARAARAVSDLDGASADDSCVHVDLRTLVAHHAPSWQALVEADGRRLRLDTPRRPVVTRGDPVRLAQAVANLVANAAEHGRGEVAVRLRAAAAVVAVDVCDAGAGLPAPVGELVARPRRGRGRRGRGLAIAASIAEAHGGRLCCAPSPSGARLVLELPAAAPGGGRVEVVRVVGVGDAAVDGVPGEPVGAVAGVPGEAVAAVAVAPGDPPAECAGAPREPVAAVAAASAEIPAARAGAPGEPVAATAARGDGNAETAASGAPLAPGEDQP